MERKANEVIVKKANDVFEVILLKARRKLEKNVNDKEYYVKESL